MAHKNLLPNNATRRAITAFMRTRPQLWQTDEIYTSENLKRHLLAAVGSRDLINIEAIVKRDPRLLTRELLEHRTLLQLALTASPDVLQLVINELGLERLRTLPEIATDNGVTSFKTTALRLGSAGARILIQSLAWIKATVQEQFEEAIRANNADLVRVCLDLGELSANVEAVDAGGATLLHHAIEANDVALAGRFLEFGANIETLAPPTNDTALLHAVRSNKPEVLALLLASHPRPNLEAIDSAGNSALHLAFNLGFVDLIPLLVNAGADLEAKDTAGNTALLRAVRLDTEQRLDLVRLMLERAERPAAIDATNSAGETALHLASNLGFVDLIPLLVNAGADLEAKDTAGNTALLRAVRLDTERRLDLVRLMLERTERPAVIDAANSDGETALHLAFNLGFVDLIPLLVNAGADLEAKDTAGNTALLRAVRLDTEQRLDLVRLMLKRAERPAVIDATNGAGETALHLAFNLGFVDLIPLLVNAGADLEAKDTAGNTALLRAVRLDTEQRSDLVRLMLERAERPAVIDAANSDGETALHLVARLGDNPQVHELATLLLDSGIDGLAMNVQGKKPEKVAFKAGNSILAKLISRKNIDLAAVRVLQQSGAIATPALSPSQAVRPRSTISGLSPEDTIDFADLRYGTDDYLGEGSFARVYRGTWRHGNVEREVAIKELVAPGLSPTAASELVSEASIMRQLRHANVLGLFGVCAEPGHYSLVMEYMPKGSLYAVLQSSESDTWNWTVKWNIALGVVRGVEHLHGHRPQILHRDLKSLNVLLDANNVPKLTDFGLSQVRTETLRTTAARPQNPAAAGAAAAPIAGTFAWMAPELISDLDAVYTKACDVFSCGVILWEIASRRTPWARPGRVITDQQIAVSVSNGKRETIPEGTPSTYAAMIGRCWEQRAESRPRIEEVTQELEQHRSEALPITEAYLCPITGEIMRDPVMDRDGHTFERGAIEQWVRDHHNCPISRAPLELADLAPNRVLRDLIEEFLTANPALRPASCSATAPSPAAPAP